MITKQSTSYFSDSCNDIIKAISSLVPSKKFYVNVEFRNGFKVNYDNANLTASEVSTIETYLTGKGIT